MERSGLRVWAALGLVAACLLLWRLPCDAVPLDKDGDIKLGVRTYVNARIATENTDREFQFDTSIAPGSPPSGAPTLRSRTFPYSPAGHLRQNRYFVEAELDWSMERLVKEGIGPLSLMNLMPFKINGLKTHFTYRGEADMLYNWGPDEYSTADQYFVVNPNGQQVPAFSNPATGSFVNIGLARQNLRDLSTVRNRLFQAYVEGAVPMPWKGPLFVRLGRQILSWGETDGFRLLDNINPLDSSFGGFLISLDERRVPLDMLRMQYFTGNIGPLNESFLELYAAIDNKVGFIPGTPAGSPWTLPNLGAPSATTQSIMNAPPRTIDATRGGGRFVFNVSDATFSVAQYFTYFDTPGLQINVRPGFPVFGIENPNNIGYPGNPKLFIPSDPNAVALYSAQAIQTAPRVSVTGGSATFALPSLYTVVRSELAYFHNEPRFSQANIDPFIFSFFFNGQECRGADCVRKRSAVFGEGNNVTGGRRVGNSFNYVVGFDINQFIRPLNPQQTFFISTQFFYKHLFDAVQRAQVPGRYPFDGEVLPVPQFETYVPGTLAEFGAVEPNFIKQPTDQFLQTFFVTTSYMSGKVNPGFLFFYDWGGSFVYQPSVTLVRDPFRLTVDYSILEAGSLKGGSGVSLLRDRDNIQFRIEYVI